MRSVEPELPVPTREVSLRNVADFEQILSSKLFTHYEKKSSELDVASLSELSSIGEVELAARRLVKANRRLLNMGPTPMRILSLTTRAIDAVFGRLPGVLAEFAAGEAQQFLGADRRLVIYFAQALLSGILKPSASEVEIVRRRIKSISSGET